MPATGYMIDTNVFLQQVPHPSRSEEWELCRMLSNHKTSTERNLNQAPNDRTTPPRNHPPTLYDSLGCLLRSLVNGGWLCWRSPPGPLSGCGSFTPIPAQKATPSSMVTLPRTGCCTASTASPALMASIPLSSACPVIRSSLCSASASSAPSITTPSGMPKSSLTSQAVSSSPAFPQKWPRAVPDGPPSGSPPSAPSPPTTPPSRSLRSSSFSASRSPSTALPVCLKIRSGAGSSRLPSPSTTPPCFVPTEHCWPSPFAQPSSITEQSSGAPPSCYAWPWPAPSSPSFPSSPGPSATGAPFTSSSRSLRVTPPTPASLPSPASTAGQRPSA